MSNEKRITKEMEKADYILTIYVKCPFCKEECFDLPGFKAHYLNGYCQVFNDTIVTP